jgi:hypothetical protein
MPFSFILLVYINIEKFSHHNTLVSSIVMSHETFISCLTGAGLPVVCNSFWYETIDPCSSIQYGGSR